MLLALQLLELLGYVVYGIVKLVELIRDEPKEWGIGLGLLGTGIAWLVPWFVSTPLVAIGALLVVFERNVQG